MPPRPGGKKQKPDKRSKPKAISWYSVTTKKPQQHNTHVNSYVETFANTATKTHTITTTTTATATATTSASSSSSSSSSWSTLFTPLLSCILAMGTDSSCVYELRRRMKQSNEQEWKQWQEHRNQEEEEEEEEYPEDADSDGRARIDYIRAEHARMTKYVHIRKHVDEDMLQLACINKHWHAASRSRSAWAYSWFHDIDDPWLYKYDESLAVETPLIPIPTSSVIARMRHAFRLSHYYMIGVELSAHTIFDTELYETMTQCFQRAVDMGSGLQQFICQQRWDWSHVGVPFMRLITTPGLFSHLIVLELTYDGSPHSPSRASTYEHQHQHAPQSADLIHVDPKSPCLFPRLHRLVLPVWPTTRALLHAVSSHHMPSLSHLDLSIHPYDGSITPHVHLAGLSHMRSLTELHVTLQAGDDGDDYDIGLYCDGKESDALDRVEDVEQYVGHILTTLLHPDIRLSTLHLSMTTSLFPWMDVIPLITHHTGLCASLNSLSLSALHDGSASPVSDTLSLKPLRSLTSLHINDANMNDDAIIAMELNRIPKLTQLSVKCGWWDGCSIPSWCDSPFHALTTISVREPRECAKYILPLLQSCPCITSLELIGCDHPMEQKRCQFNQQHMEILATRHIKHLNLKHVDFPSSSVPLLCSMSSLVSLSLTASCVPDMAAVAQLDHLIEQINQRNKQIHTHQHTEITTPHVNNNTQLPSFKHVRVRSIELYR